MLEAINNTCFCSKKLLSPKHIVVTCTQWRHVSHTTVCVRCALEWNRPDVQALTTTMVECVVLWAQSNYEKLSFQYYGAMAPLLWVRKSTKKWRNKTHFSKNSLSVKNAVSKRSRLREPHTYAWELRESDSATYRHLPLYRKPACVHRPKK